MSLEAVVYQQGLYGHNNDNKDLYSLLEDWGRDFDLPKQNPQVQEKPKRIRRTRRRSNKNKGDIESQRMSHIEIERNRRKQMNEYLCVLKSLIPNSYSQRGDQASIVGGAIKFVKELEQNLNCLSAQKMHNAENIEVTMVESHVNLKIRSRKRPKQLMYMVSGLQDLRLSILHLNISNMDQYALYSISAKVEDGSKLNSEDEIFTAVQQLLGRIEEDTRSI